MNAENIFIVTGPFSAGKTVMANSLTEHLGGKDNVIRVVDGPHLVDIVTTEAHGAMGLLPSETHFHAWQAEDPLASHNHEGDLDHFPFTILDPGVGAEMFAKTGKELIAAASTNLPVVVELGTGLSACQISKADFSTQTFLETMQREGLLGVLVERLGRVIAVDADWRTRLIRNAGRVQEADGVEQSWGMQEEGLRITFASDFKAWGEVGVSVLPFENNEEGTETMLRWLAENF